MHGFGLLIFLKLEIGYKIVLKSDTRAMRHLLHYTALILTNIPKFFLGGQVQSIRCTETYIASSKSYILLGWTVYTSSSSPRDAINPGMAPGQCWAFVGSQGYLVLQLSHTIIVSGFTMEHISRLLVPNGHIESAPKNFSMWVSKKKNT